MLALLVVPDLVDLLGFTVQLHDVCLDLAHRVLHRFLLLLGQLDVLLGVGEGFLEAAVLRRDLLFFCLQFLEPDVEGAFDLADHGRLPSCLLSQFLLFSDLLPDA